MKWGVTVCAFTPDSKGCLIGMSGSIWLWAFDSNTLTLLFNPIIHSSGDITSIIVTRGRNRRFIWVTNRGSIGWSDLSRYDYSYFEEQDLKVTSVTAEPQGRFWISGSEDGRILL